MDIKRWFEKELEDRLKTRNPFHFGNLKKEIHVPGMYVIYYPGEGLYVGSTGHLYRRRIKHIADLKNGVGENKKLQEAFDRSEDKRFIFCFVIAKDREHAFDLEQQALDAFQGDPLLCNSGKNARSPTAGTKYTEERRRSMSNERKAFLSNNPDFVKMLSKTSKENWENNREAMVEKAIPNLRLGILATSMPVEIDGVIYSSIAEAGRALSIVATGVAYRINSKNFPTWKKVMKKENKPKLTVDGIILWSDGGCSPNPGDGGWGFHGYTYSNEPPTKGTGNSDFYVTDKGYVMKSFLDAFNKGEDPYEKLDAENLKQGSKSVLEEHLKAKQVTPLEYFDFFGPASAAPEDPRGRSTNNRAEVTALIKALEFCIAEDIRNIQIKTDSEYTLMGWNKVLYIWQKNKWRRQDGTEIKSKDLWIEAWDLKSKLEGFTVKAEWIQGHSIFLGNNMADMNATLGKNMAISGMGPEEAITERSLPQGYWGDGDFDRHPLIAHQKLFFNGEYENHVPGTYFLGAVDKDMGLLGKRLSDSSYSVLILKKPLPELELLIKHQCAMGDDDNELVVCHLSSFYKPRIQKQFMDYGTFSLYRQESHLHNLHSSDKQLITEAIDPPKQSLNAVLAMNNIYGRLKDFLDNDVAFYTLTDLTDHLYESTIVQKKKTDVVETKLKASIKPGVASIAVDANYRDSNGAEFTLPTTLSFGIDLPDRNGLKRVEEFTPQVTLLSWEESPGVFRYFTVIQAQDDVGAYCGYYSNVRLNKVVKSKAK